MNDHDLPNFKSPLEWMRWIPAVCLALVIIVLFFIGSRVVLVPLLSSLALAYMLEPLVEVFDCPVTVVSSPNRATSTVSPQALALMNNEFVLEQAKFFAERVTTEAGADANKQITRAFQIALHRKPSKQEQEWSLNFLKSQMDGYSQRKHERPDAAALRDFCHALLNLNEFLYVD